jgi:hypothetical protein
MERQPNSLELETEITPDSGPDEEFATCDDLSDTDSIKSSIFEEEMEPTGESHLYRYSISSPLPLVEEGEEVISPRNALLAVQIRPDNQYTEALQNNAKMLDESLKETGEEIQNDPANSGEENSSGSCSTNNAGESALDNSICAKSSILSITETSMEQIGMYQGQEVILQNYDNPSLKQRKIDHYSEAPIEEEKISRSEYLRRFGKKVLPPPPEDGA